MTTVGGTLEQRHHDGVPDQWVQARTILLGGVMIRIRTVIDSQTIVARGIEPVALLSLREGESVEVTYHCGRNGYLVAHTVSVWPDAVAVFSEMSTTGEEKGHAEQGARRISN